MIQIVPDKFMFHLCGIASGAASVASLALLWSGDFRQACYIGGLSILYALWTIAAKP